MSEHPPAPVADQPQNPPPENRRGLLLLGLGSAAALGTAGAGAAGLQGLLPKADAAAPVSRQPGSSPTPTTTGSGRTPVPPVPNPTPAPEQTTTWSEEPAAPATEAMPAAKGRSPESNRIMRAQDGSDAVDRDASFEQARTKIRQQVDPALILRRSPESAHPASPDQPARPDRTGSADPSAPTPSTGVADPVDPSGEMTPPVPPSSSPTPEGTPSASPRQAPARAPAVASARVSVTWATSPAAVAAGVSQPANAFGAAGPLTEEQARAHLIRRCTFGASPADLASLEELGIDAWLAAQLSPTALEDPDGARVARSYNKAGTGIAAVVGSIKRYSWEAVNECVLGAVGMRMYSARQLFEVTVDVLANLLHVSMPSGETWSGGPDYYASVIRKHAFGSYRVMLLAAMRHPAMLRYLNNEKSTRAHVNENLGRELLELHTVGVAGGYTEADVLNSAWILSGRGIDGPSQEFRYHPERHYLGAVKVLDFTADNASADGGLDLGDAYLDYLATHPGTARTLARRLAVRFVSDSPSEELVNHLAQTYLDHDTAIVPVLQAIVTSEEFWSSVGSKTKRPQEDLISTVRALGYRPQGQLSEAVKVMRWRLVTTGHCPMGWDPPDGFPDVASAWQSSGQMLTRWSTHRALTGGWWKGLDLPDDRWKPHGDETVGAWVDRITGEIAGLHLPAAARSVIIEFLGRAEGDPAAPVGHLGLHVAALMLDSIYWQLH
ncbi:MAG: DUF1800 family protein [Propioniciclava sp.]